MYIHMAYKAEDFMPVINRTVRFCLRQQKKGLPSEDKKLESSKHGLPSVLAVFPYDLG